MPATAAIMLRFIHNFNDYISIARLQSVVFYITLCCSAFIFDISCSWENLYLILYHLSMITIPQKFLYRLLSIKVMIGMSPNWLIMTLINYIDHFVVTFLNPTCYAGIMLDAFNNLLCSNLHWHNRPGPSSSRT